MPKPPKPILGRAPDGTFLPGNSARFEEGNQAALKAGHRSESIVRARSSEVRQELTAHLAEHLPHLAPADQPLVDLAVDLLTKLRLVNEHLEQTSGGSLIDRRGVVRNSARVYLELMRHALTVFDRMGIGPRARAGIMADLGLGQERRAVVVEQAQQRLRARVAEGDDSES